MNGCGQESLVEHYHDGELDWALRAPLESHMAECPECARHLAELRKVSSLLSATQQLEITSIDQARMHAAAASVQHRVGEWSVIRISAPLLGLAASLLIASSVCLGLFQTQSAAQSGQDWQAIASGAAAIPTSVGATSDVSAWMVRNLGGNTP